jgi:hypothetical protein
VLRLFSGQKKDKVDGKLEDEPVSTTLLAVGVNRVAKKNIVAKEPAIEPPTLTDSPLAHWYLL